MRGITTDERALVNHISMWGSQAYPVLRYGTKWHWVDWRGVKGAPVVYKTKTEAVEAFERFHEILLDALAGRI